MMSTVYSAVQRFNSACGQTWSNFIEWSGLRQLREVISLDGILCPNFFEEVTAEDWQHNVQEDFKIHLFHDLDYVFSRVVGQEHVNVLALLENPTVNEVRSFGDSRFVFRGFDLMDHCGDISALLNCGGFDKAFSSTNLSDCGLLTDHAKALSVQKRLRVKYPDERHAMCDLLAIWQLKREPEFDGELNLPPSMSSHPP